jgi:uncharacterized membrane-anchored protein
MTALPTLAFGPLLAPTGCPAPALAHRSGAGLANKLPALTVFFWIMKICATTLGETAGDLLSMTMKVGYAATTLILMGFFVATLIGQLAARRHIPPLYWAVILSTSTAGTTMSDYMDRTLGLGYAKGSLILAALLGAVFGIWRLTGESFSVKDIRSRKVEILYWVAILFSNTLGTALGDYLSDDSGLGFAGSAAIIGGLLAVLAALYFLTRLSRVMLFWFAFILTRPFGAELGDVLTKDHDKGGLGFGTIGSSIVLAVILVAVIVYTSWKQGRAAPRTPTAPTPLG